MGRFLKKFFNRLPMLARAVFFAILCRIFVGQRRPVASPKKGLLYIIGNFSAEGGIARSAQLSLAVLRAEHRRCIAVDTTGTNFQPQQQPPAAGLSQIKDVKRNTEPATVVLHLNPPQLQWTLCKLGKKFLRNKRIVACWAWELEAIPLLWKYAIPYVDAIEVPSRFTCQAIRRNTDKPVTVRPYPLQELNDGQRYDGPAGQLRCLFIFDLASRWERKNPQAVISAFTAAFSPGEAVLTIKVIHAKDFQNDLKKLKKIIDSYPHITILTQWLDEKALRQLYRQHNVYLSLHRSEGFGLTIREAMLFGLFIVATGWSGNMDFMHGKTVYPVPFRLVPLEKREQRYWGVSNARWAEPDIEQASVILRNIYRRYLKNISDESA